MIHLTKEQLRTLFILMYKNGSAGIEPEEAVKLAEEMAELNTEINRLRGEK